MGNYRGESFRFAGIEVSCLIKLPQSSGFKIILGVESMGSWVISAGLMTCGWVLLAAAASLVLGAIINWGNPKDGE